MVNLSCFLRILRRNKEVDNPEVATERQTEETRIHCPDSPPLVHSDIEIETHIKYFVNLEYIS